MKRIMKCVFLLLCCLSISACSYWTHPTMRAEFDKSTKEFNRMLRWLELEQAGIKFMEPDLRDDYFKNVESIKKRGLTFTDFRILASECLPDSKSGDVVAEFDYYILPSNKIKTTTYRQKWSYKDYSDGWKLKSGLPDFE